MSNGDLGNQEVSPVHTRVSLLGRHRSQQLAVAAQPAQPDWKASEVGL